MAPAARKKDWIIMYAIPKVADEMSKEFPNASFTFNKVPLLSHLAVPSNVATPAGSVDYPYIAAVDDCGFLLLCGYTVVGLTYYLCDPYFRRTLGILPPDNGFNSRSTVGFMRNRRDKHPMAMVAKLNTGLLQERRRVTLSCTVDMSKWADKEADCSRVADTKQGWCCDGVLSHEGFLWWFDLDSFMLACDPFEDKPRLCQIMFPHVPDALPSSLFPVEGDKYRCLKGSQGRLRYVQIHGDAAGNKLVVSMWTLSSNNPADAVWETTHKVPLAEIWNHRTYKAKLLPEAVPTVMLVHPMKAHRVYFFLGQHIFRVNLQKRSVRQRRELNNQELPALCSLTVHAWQLPAKASKIRPSGPDESHVPGDHFLPHYDSVDDFLGKALDVMSRSCPELYGMELEDDSETMEELDDRDDEDDCDSWSDLEV